jgi:hypothetical protein
VIYTERYLASRCPLCWVKILKDAYMVDIKIIVSRSSSTHHQKLNPTMKSYLFGINQNIDKNHILCERPVNFEPTTFF